MYQFHSRWILYSNIDGVLWRLDLTVIFVCILQLWLHLGEKEKVIEKWSWLIGWVWFIDHAGAAQKFVLFQLSIQTWSNKWTREHSCKKVSKHLKHEDTWHADSWQLLFISYCMNITISQFICNKNSLRTFFYHIIYFKFIFYGLGYANCILCRVVTSPNQKRWPGKGVMTSMINTGWLTDKCK